MVPAILENEEELSLGQEFKTNLNKYTKTSIPQNHLFLFDLIFFSFYCLFIILETDK